MRISASALAAAALVLAGSAAAQAQMETELLASNCFSCHGPRGQSVGEIPTLTGMPAKDLAEKFRAFRDDKAPGTIMGRIAKGYTDQQVDAIAAYIAKQGYRSR